MRLKSLCRKLNKIDKFREVKKLTEELVSIFPSICADHDEEKYHIEIELPGVKKEDIELEMSDESFCIKAPKEDIVYSACYRLAHAIDTGKASAKFDNGLLTVTVPFEHSLKGVKISIE